MLKKSKYIKSQQILVYSDKLKMKIGFIILSFLISFSLFAWETDNFSSRVQLRKMSKAKQQENLFKLNDYSNSELEKAIKHFNTTKGECHLDKKKNIPDILEIVKNTLGGGFISGNIEDWAGDTEKSKLIIPKIEKDIYSALLWTPDPAVNFGGVIAGVDKLGHFIDQGFSVFSKFKNTSDSIEEALKFSDNMEESYFGLNASGVKSYGDLAANFAGFRFYQNILQGEHPHIGCNETNGKYKLATPLNWADYINNSLDEGINCSLFFSMPGPVTAKQEEKMKRADLTGNKTSFTRTKVIWKREGWRNGKHHRARKRELSKKHLQVNSKGKALYENLNLLYLNEYSKSENKELELNNYCPVENNKCSKLIKKNCASYILSPSCYLSVPGEKSYQCKVPTIERPVKKHDHNNYNYRKPSHKSEKVETNSATKE